jgi:uncharacterized protein
VRGVALPGIALMNIEWFSRWPGEIGMGIPAGLPPADHAAAWLIVVLVQGKFWLMFALLFGAGFAVMQARADAAGTPLVAAYLRRAAMLFAFGIAHAWALWVGDILHTYALSAVLLLLFLRMPPLGRGVFGAMLFVLASVGIGAGALLYLLAPDVGGPGVPVDPAFAADAARAAAVYAHGDYAAVSAQRLADFKAHAGSNLFLVPIALAVFLFGSWLLDSGRLSRPEEHLRFHRAMAFVALPVGLALTVWAATLATGVSMAPTDAEMAAQFLSWIGAPPMTLGYIGAIVLAARHPVAGAWLRRWLAPPGRMALTNYLMMSAICSSLFFGYGFALWGQVSRTGQVAIVAAIFAGQALLSRAWLARFRYGPLEWLWRAFTWLRWPPLRH